jgi:hypothetical protein
MSEKYSDQYWSFLKELKSHTVYLHEYMLASEKNDNRLNIFMAIASSTSIAGWAIWNSLGFIWAVIIAASQVVNAVRPFLPFGKRIKPLRSICYLYEDILLRMERKWFDIENGNLTEKEIHEALYAFREEKEKGWKNIIDDLSIPHNPELHDEAISVATNYFQLHYEQ